MAEFTPQQITWLERYMRLMVGRQVQQAVAAGTITTGYSYWELDSATLSVLDTSTILA